METATITVFYIIVHDYKNAGMHKNSMIMLISNMYIQKMTKLKWMMNTVIANINYSNTMLL